MGKQSAHVIRHTSPIIYHLGIILDLALIHSSTLPLYAPQSAPTPLHVEPKVAFVRIAIWPNADAFAVPEDSLIREDVRREA
jgi:hypothetical protein